MPLKLEVPFADKDQAKSLGAIWVPQEKVWTVPDYVKDINPFKNWIADTSDCIVRKPYLLCLSKTNCLEMRQRNAHDRIGCQELFLFRLCQRQRSQK